MSTTRFAAPRGSHISARAAAALVTFAIAAASLIVPSTASAAPGDDAPVSLTAPVAVATVVGDEPDLPRTVSVTTAAGTTRDAPVAWDLSDLSFDQHYRSIQVPGLVDGVLATTASVETVPDDVLYFIDSNAPGGISTSYSAVKALEGSSLRNQVADQALTAGDWGWLATGRGGARPGTAGDKDSSGHYGQNSPSGDWLRYTLADVPAGTWTLTTGHAEWWTGPRTMTVSVTTSVGTTSSIATGVTVGAAANLQKNRMASGSFTQPSAGSVTVNVYRSAGTEAPVIGWLALAKGSVAVDTTPLTVAAPTASVAAGTYKTAQTVSLATTTASASIYYTTDGSVPTKASGTRFEGPITVDSSVTIKAVAIKNGTLSAATSVSYAIELVPTDGYESVPVGKTWYDTEGNSIQAHGGGFLEKDGWYWWVGENKSHDGANLYAVSLYRSKDLTNWEHVNDIVTAGTPGICSTGTYSGDTCKIERPKLVYNEATETYVLWGHWETADSYAASHLVVLTSKTIGGDYELVRNFRPGVGEVHTEEVDPTYSGSDGKSGYGSRDFTVFQDGDTGDAYLVGSQDHLSMRVYKLTDDFTDVDWKGSYVLFDGDRREAPALVKAGDGYFVFTSSQSGWYPNQTMYSYTEDISDPDGWSELKPAGNNTSFYSQPTNIMTLAKADGTPQYIYMGDRWNSKKLGSSSYVWLPLQIDGESAALTFTPEWSLDADTGEVSVPSVDLVSERKPVVATTAGTGYPASAANDGIVINTSSSGDNTNYYLPTSVPYSWQVDLGEQRDLSRIDLSFRSYNGSESYSGYTVSGSNDGTTWKRLVNESDNRTVGFKSNALSGSFRYVSVSVSNVVNDHNGSAAAWAAGLVEVQVYATPEIPADDGATAAPGVGILSSDEGWDTGLRDGSFTITMNLWWGENASQFVLYQDGQPVKKLALTPATPKAQTANVAIAGLKNGTYVFTGELRNSQGTTKTGTVTVKVTDAAPTAPVLMSDNWDADGAYTVTAYLWWGTNATSYRFREDGVVVKEGALTALAPGAQQAALAVDGRAKGAHMYTVEFINAAGATTSAPLSVNVTK